MPLGSPLGFAWHGIGTLAAPALRLMLRRRLARGKEIPGRLPERWGRDPTTRPPGRLLWVHAASVGEAASVLPVIDAVLGRDPELTVLATTGTSTSAALLARRATPRVLHRFVPLDVPGWVARFLDHWRPDAAAFVESEIWPNLLAAAARRRIPLALVNARLSAGSARGWGRVPGFAREVFGRFAWVQARSPADAARLQVLGARNVSAPGDLKFAADPLPADPAELARLEALLAGGPRWVAASTHPGEEAIAAAAHRLLLPEFPALVTVIAPRHPERGPALAAELDAPCRGAGEDPRPGLPWIADTLGELGLLYRLAPVVLMGKSLAGQGGQNPLEPARLGCAVACGPHTGNFAEACAVLEQAHALARVQDAATLAAWVGTMLRDRVARDAAGAAAAGVASGAAGLPDTVAAALLELMPDATA